MDSLTQIVLGAAVGEVVLGKKAGNRAMLWGAVAGTIPDLDIIGNAFLNDINALVVHRGLSHSIFFSVLSPVVFGWLVHQFYQRGIDRQVEFKKFISGLGVLFGLLLVFGVILRPIFSGNIPSLIPSSVVLLIVFWLFRRIWRYNYNLLTRLGEEPSCRDWSWLFFWGIFTHPMLDCFTTYGTQIFQPFSDYRVGFNSISVADPIYTLPFLICLIYASTLLRGSSIRSIINWMGISLSSIYLLFTVGNKFYFNQQFEKSLAHYNLKYDRFMSTPTIFNQVLWAGIAETDHCYYYGVRSVFDKGEFMEIDSLYKNHHLLAPYENSNELETLKWFTNGYYNAEKNPSGEIALNDLRFGIIGNLEEPKDTSRFVFQFYLSKNGEAVEVDQRRDGTESRDLGYEFGKLWKRMGGE